MNHTLRKAVTSLQPKHQLGTRVFSWNCIILPVTTTTRARKFLDVEGSLNLNVPCQRIHNWESKYRIAIKVRRLKEQFKNPERFEKPNPRYSYTDWNYNSELYACGKRLGEDFDNAVLREALTDQSYIHKERKRQEELGLETESLQLTNNDDLYSQGSMIAEETLIAFLNKEIPQFPPEGHKAIIKYLMSKETLANVATNLGFRDLILCEEYPPSPDTYSRAFLALVGAVQKSSGLERAEKFVLDFIASLLCGKDINEIWEISRPWQMMVELAKSKGLYPVEPRMIGEAGRNTIHAVFVVGIYDKNKKMIGKGFGETLDIAQEMSARDALKGFFNSKNPLPPFEFQSTNIPYKLIPHVRNIHKQ